MIRVFYSHNFLLPSSQSLLYGLEAQRCAGATKVLRALFEFIRSCCADPVVGVVRGELAAEALVHADADEPDYTTALHVLPPGLGVDRHHAPVSDRTVSTRQLRLTEAEAAVHVSESLLKSVVGECTMRCLPAWCPITRHDTHACKGARMTLGLCLQLRRLTTYYSSTVVSASLFSLL
jgi:hypothetical protein